MRRTRKGGGGTTKLPPQSAYLAYIGKVQRPHWPFIFFCSPKNSVFTSASVFQLFVAVFPPGFVDVTLYTAGANGLTLFIFLEVYSCEKIHNFKSENPQLFFVIKREFSHKSHIIVIKHSSTFIQLQKKL